MSLQLVAGVVEIASAALLVLASVHWMATLEDLARDHLNPRDAARELNWTVKPALGLLAAAAAAYALTLDAPGLLLAGLQGYAVWRVRAAWGGSLQLDPTTIFRDDFPRRGARLARFALLGLGLALVYALHRPVVAFVSKALSLTGGTGRLFADVRAALKGIGRDAKVPVGPGR